MVSQNIKVLVLEDSSTQARLISRMFESFGVATEIFTSAAELKTFRPGNPIDAVAALVDVHFGDVNGLTLLPSIQHMWPGIPMIMMTANKKDDYRVLAEAREHGIDIVLPKPFSKDTVREALLDIKSIRDTGVRRRHVVLIDDSASSRRIAGTLLETLGYRVSVFENGLDAIQQLSFDFVDVVLTDLNMPEMDGNEIINLVRDVWGDVGIVAMSADEKLCKSTEMIDGFVSKPFSAQKLFGAIESAMPRKIVRNVRPVEPETVMRLEEEEAVFELDC